jgi:hypothetical protein
VTRHTNFIYLFSREFIREEKPQKSQIKKKLRERLGPLSSSAESCIANYSNTVSFPFVEIIISQKNFLGGEGGL